MKTKPKISYKYQSPNKAKRNLAERGIAEQGADEKGVAKQGIVIEYIILHYTEMSFEDAVERLCSPKYEVSAHYLIHKNGEIFQLVNDEDIAWHAGVSYWRGKERLNQNSIGIEMDNLGNTPFTEAQYDSLISLCKELMKKHKIPAENVIGHSDIAPDRKVDPGIFFDWQKLAREGIGMEIMPVNKTQNANILLPVNTQLQEGDLNQMLPEVKTEAQSEMWPETQPKVRPKISPAALPKVRSEVQPESLSEARSILQAIGYNVAADDSSRKSGELDKQTSSAIRAFLSHFHPGYIIEKYTTKYGHEYYMNLDSYYELDEEVMQALGQYKHLLK